jgi:hypothetical protein
MKTEENDKIVKDPMIQEAEEKGLQVEAELARMLEVQKEWTVDQIEKDSALVYDIIFDSYDPNEENGVMTDKYSLLETENGSEVFILKQL